MSAFLNSGRAPKLAAMALSGSARDRTDAAALTWLKAAAVACAAMLAIAHGFETFGHYPPCELCLHQREVYWVGLWIALTGLIITRLRLSGPWLFTLLLGLTFAAETILAGYHAGVEWKWWPGPVSCTGSHARVSAADMASLLRGTPVHMVRCDAAAWRLAGLSMAGWNAIAAALLALTSFAAASTIPRRGSFR